MKQLFTLLRKRWYYPLGALAWNMLVYSGGRMLAGGFPHQNWELPLDHLIPFVPWTVVIYLSCYLFWGVSYCLIATGELGLVRRFFAAEVAAKTVCLVCFVLLPTTNVRPDIVGHSVWDWLMGVVYTVDAPDNLFPSIHCLVSWMCYIGARKDPRCPKPARLTTLICALAVFVSTLTTKQHVVVDVAAGVAVAEACYYATGKLLSRRERTA